MHVTCKSVTISAIMRNLPVDSWHWLFTAKLNVGGVFLFSCYLWLLCIDASCLIHVMLTPTELIHAYLFCWPWPYSRLCNTRKSKWWTVFWFGSDLVCWILWLMHAYMYKVWQFLFSCDLFKGNNCCLLLCSCCYQNTVAFCFKTV